MRYGLLGASVCILGIAVSVIAPLGEQRDTVRYHQHKEALAKDESTRRDDVFSTHLPLVEIDTGGVEIPGKRAYDEKGHPFYTTTEDGEPRIGGHMTVIDHEKAYNCQGDTPDISTDIEINVRR